jgi:methanogenic corrinoid protein MtbC1
MRDSFDELKRGDAPTDRQGVAGAFQDLQKDRSDALGFSDLSSVLIGPIHCDEIKRFTDHLLNEPEDQAAKQFVSFLEKGHPVSAVFETLLAGAAHEMGLRWERDDCSFADVTLGMAVIHRLLRRYSDALVGEVTTVLDNPVVLVTPLPGEAHIFAAALLAEHFRAGGWRVHSGIHSTLPSVIQNVKEHHVDIVAVTLSSADKLEETDRLIQQIRSRSRNMNVRVIVGGPPFSADSRLHRAIGADATAADFVSALDVASHLAAK